MWLLHVDTFELKEFIGTNPPYAILSHTWASDEIPFAEMRKAKYRDLAKQKTGFSKIDGCCARAKADGYAWVWIDSCCIDKRSSAELSEAINSMFKWYQCSRICYVYLSDVPGGNEDFDVVAKSRWFTRGWTLQELLAPRDLLFLAQDWTVLGYIGAHSYDHLCNAYVDDPTPLNHHELTQWISLITRIPKEFISGGKRLEQACVSQRMFWASQRTTTRPEDRAYSLMGLFDINMPILYGEGLEKAFTRLQEEIFRSTPDQSIFAWHYSGMSSYRLLADSPDCFQNSGNVVRLLQESSLAREAECTRSAFYMTNLGLRITLPLHTVTESISRDDSKTRMEAKLHCYVHGKESGPCQVSLNLFYLDTDISGRVIYMCQRSSTWNFSTGGGHPTSIFIRGISYDTETAEQQTSLTSSVAFDEVEVASRSLGIIGDAVDFPAEVLKDDVPFAELGVDSLVLVELMSRIKDELGVQICTQDFYNNPTIGEFVAFLVAAVGLSN
ncbi:uncharacterized protein N0V89_002147 [Didymosphaeria variabile]|uniref:Carrier domain-containing protein n=1 Tax=Didymosphaeria variabile TaxID=1932322 RepID=A0A9W8XRJ0_9PLEO|nr:uncharacterized protein N0V89_002147 [Didymosphaeria variabile]KAJ4357571.1 hypothetical protein N0V89_002147 [Didymosphaeria variabile]